MAQPLLLFSIPSGAAYAGTDIQADRTVYLVGDRRRFGGRLGLELPLAVTMRVQLCRSSAVRITLSTALPIDSVSYIGVGTKSAQ
jgi:hypothetical protein